MCIRFTEPWEPAEVGGTQASAPFIFVKDQNVKKKTPVYKTLITKIRII
jgi:hypothetical protein